MFSSKASLKIINVEQSDQGHYECVIENRVGMLHSNPAILYVKIRLESPKFITVPKPSYEMTEGDTLELLCEAIGHPKPIVYWKKGMTKMETFDDYERTSKSKLILNDIQHSEQYMCVAASKFGQITAETKIIVNSSAKTDSKQLTPLTINSITSDTISLSWNRLMSNANECKILVSETNKQCETNNTEIVEKKEIVVNKTEYRIGNLKSDTRYDIEILCYNKSAELTLKTVKKE
ncbi:receptor type tyrosine protein phosphatase-like protein [Leptotrombidium deliense]|uniref:protein-tyrosine-phosphatase n=1 Tax=Leptotrombidium deliense TaxID=299467 RepID=A0A443S870_9ACAR|nr:receptor type tyrosine protein phosphatase-like protein [Leptotrombidium deliense]